MWSNKKITYCSRERFENIWKEKMFRLGGITNSLLPISYWRRAMLPLLLKVEYLGEKKLSFNSQNYNDWFLTHFLKIFFHVFVSFTETILSYPSFYCPTPSGSNDTYIIAVCQKKKKWDLNYENCCFTLKTFQLTTHKFVFSRSQSSCHIW